MLEIGAMELGIMMAEGELVTEMVLALAGSSKLVDFMRKAPKEAARLRRRLFNWGDRVRADLRRKPVPPAMEREYLAYQACRPLSCRQLLARSQTILEALEPGSPFSLEAPSLLSQLRDSPTEARRRLLMERWRTSLVAALLRFQQELAEAEREKQQQELESQLLANRELVEALDPEQVSAGGLWDLAQGKWHPRSLVLVRQYAAMLEKEPLLREIAELLGRSDRDKERDHQPKPPEPMIELEPVISDEVPDDLVGIHPAGDLLRMLPSESVMLGDPDLEYEFYRRYLERRLLSYQPKGMLPRQRLIPLQPRDQGREEQQRGPFIVCVDTSGSMGGYPEECAKALFLALLKVAMAEQRPCFLMLFSTEVVTLEITAETGLEKAERFLSMSFHGGTDLVPCLERALTQLEAPAFLRADVLMLSDFVAQRLPQALLDRLNQRRAAETRFYAVAMSRHAKQALLRIFDRSWLLDCSLPGRWLRHWRQP